MFLDLLQTSQYDLKLVSNSSGNWDTHMMKILLLLFVILQIPSYWMTALRCRHRALPKLDLVEVLHNDGAVTHQLWPSSVCHWQFLKIGTSSTQIILALFNQVYSLPRH